MDRSSVESTAWPVSWSAVWVGTLAALAVGLIIGLIGYAVGAHEMARFVDWEKVRLTGLMFSVGGAFFSFVVGEWVAGRIAGFRRAEPAMLHGAIVWTLGLTLLLVLGAVGAAQRYGEWYAGLAGSPAWSSLVPPADPDLAARVRNTALASVVALLISLVGSVLGGWMASGEPMTLTYYRRRDRDPFGAERTRRIA
jgi:hypothetical protein